MELCNVPRRNSTARFVADFMPHCWRPRQKTGEEIKLCKPFQTISITYGLLFDLGGLVDDIVV